MAVAALPRYLSTQDLATASPGLRFGMYLLLWGKDNRHGDLLWTTFDVNYRVAGRNREEREFKDSNKAEALAKARMLTTKDHELTTALCDRQHALAAAQHASGSVFTNAARAVAPFATGLGNEHPLENGFAFLNPYGLPYLPGSGVKGVLRQAARELAGLIDDARWEIPTHWDAASIDALFGKEARDGQDHQRGALRFWDVIPQIEGKALQVEVMTPHQKHYYQDGKSPHESGQPIPINFLTVPPGSRLTFHVECDRAFLERIAPELLHDDRWQHLLRDAFTHAFDWLGFGAKTTVGYGAMLHDEAAEADARERLQGAEAARRVAEENAREAARLAEERARMSPVERSIHEFLDARPNKSEAEISAVLAAARANRWSDDQRAEVARWLRGRMQAAKQWKESSQKKNPNKDKDYQNTLQVMQWLAGK